MTLFVTASGTQTATVASVDTLTTLTGPKTFTLTVDTSEMVFGSTNDELELRIENKTLTGSSELLTYYAYFVGAQDMPVKVSIPVPVPFTATVKLSQVAGTSRDFEWNVTTPDA